MGITRFKGPVYGGKGLLFTVHKDSVATSQTDLEIFQIDLPSTEDWYLTNYMAYCDDAGNAAATLDIEDDTASVLSAAITLASDDSVEGVFTTTPGEDEGKLVAASSSITVDCTSGATSGPADITLHVYGYIRKLPVS